MHAELIGSSVNMDSRIGPDLQRLREATGELSGRVFFGTLMKSMRESAVKGPYGHGGRGEEMFAEQLHGVLAQRIGASMQSNLGDLLYRHLEKQQRALGEMRTTNGGTE